MKDVLKCLPITTIIIIYLFVCGGLYLLGFWGTFEINPFSIIQIWDIPKNFISPYMLSGGLILIAVYSYFGLIAKGHFEVITRPHIFFKIASPILFIISFILGVALYESYKYSYYFWVLFSALFMALILMEVLFLPSIIRLIPVFNFRLCVIIVIVNLPILSFTYAKKNSLDIYNNISINKAVAKNNEMKSTISDTVSLKLLGFLGDKFILSSLDNKKIFVLNQSAFDVIELQKKEGK